MAILYKTTGENVGVTPRNGREFDVAELAELVHGTVWGVIVEPGRLNKCGKVLYINIDQKRLPHNKTLPPAMSPNVFYGDVVICPITEAVKVNVHL